MIGRGLGELSVVRRCALLGVARSNAYYRPTGDSAEESALMGRIDRIFTGHPMVLDWATGRVLAWRLSNTLTTGFCVAALEEARGWQRPDEAYFGQREAALRAA